MNRESNMTEKTNEKQAGGKQDDSHVLFEITLDNDKFSQTI